jgi:hypothetical protein
MLPTAASAFSDYYAAVLLAKVSGSEVPSATKVIAVTDSLKFITQPKTVATSPTTVVTNAMKSRDITKHGRPPQMFAGGTSANNTFHPIILKWHIASYQSTSVISWSSSSRTGPSRTAFLNYCAQVGSYISK